MPPGGVEKKNAERKKKTKKPSKGRKVHSNERPQRKLTPRQFIKRHEEHEDLVYVGTGLGYKKSGWDCGQCSNGFFEENPEIDHEFIGCKVQCLLEDWNNNPNINTNDEGLSISNSDDGEVIVHKVVMACDAAKKYSEAFIKETAKKEIGKSIDL